MEKLWSLIAALATVLSPPQPCRTASKGCLLPSSVSSFSHGQTWKHYVQAYLLETEPRGTLDPLFLWPFFFSLSRLNSINFSLLFNNTKAIFSQFSVCARKQDRPTRRQGQSSLLFSSGIRMLDRDGLQKLHQHQLVSSAADSPPRCSGLDFSVTKCFHTLLKEEHPNPVKGQCTPSFQCIFIPSILGSYFQIFMVSAEKDTHLWKIRTSQHLK